MGREEIRPGVSLETREYGDDDAPALVVWGHGLCNSLEGEDAERLWDFWNDDDDGAPPRGPGPHPRSFRCPRTMRVVRYAARGHGDSSPAERPDDCTWDTLGRDMLALARRRRRDVSQKLILGGASMGSASALYAARHALDDAVAGSNPIGTTPEIDGLVLVILPTFHDTRRGRSAQIVAAAERGYDATASRKKIRPIFRGTEREDEPPIAMGVRPDSFEHVMRASAVSDLPRRRTCRRGRLLIRRRSRCVGTAETRRIREQRGATGRTGAERGGSRRAVARGDARVAEGDTGVRRGVVNGREAGGGTPVVIAARRRRKRQPGGYDISKLAVSPGPPERYHVRAYVETTGNGDCCSGSVALRGVGGVTSGTARITSPRPRTVSVDPSAREHLGANARAGASAAVRQIVCVVLNHPRGNPTRPRGGRR